MQGAPRTLLASWLAAGLVEAVCCPVHGAGRFAALALASAVPSLAPAKVYAVAVGAAYRLLATGPLPPVPSMAHFRLLAEASAIVHHAGVATSTFLLAAPLVRAWAKTRYALPGDRPAFYT